MNSDIRKILDGARLVRFHDHRTAAVWHGGTTVSVYSIHDGDWTETTCLNISDKNGEPVDRETMDSHIKVWFNSE